jgi:hypothetical protein
MWEIMSFGKDPSELEDTVETKYDDICAGWRWERPEGCIELMLVVN